MIDEWNEARSGWARFSDDKSKRYRLARALTDAGARWLTARDVGVCSVVFVMLNPSTADAFKLDPTVTRCARFAELWGADVLQVVNLFAFRSPYPEDLYALARAAKDTGADAANDEAIVAACTEPLAQAGGVVRAIAAWGRHGKLNGRGDYVADLLRGEVAVECLGMTDEGFPTHPLARGRHFIPYDRKPKLWR